MNFLSNSNGRPLLIKALQGERSPQPPIWLMRQAGRYLPEYRELREKYSLLEAMQTPEVAAQITLQPIIRFGFDAAIIFADILTPLIGMGIKLDFIEGEGPKIFNPITNVSDIESLIVPTPEENVPYTLRAIEICCQELKHTNTPLIGFSGSPFTLSTYLIGKGDTNGRQVKEFMMKKPAAWEILQKKLARLVSEYLIAQVHCGASVVQLFDSWIGTLGPREFELFAAPYIESIIDEIHSSTSVPVIYFATGATGLYPQIGALGADAIGVDWRVALHDAETLLGKNIPLQGNLDPLVLAGPLDYLLERAKEIVVVGKTLRSHIFNLGHGILPHTPIGNVERLVQFVKGDR